jgi:1-acyl-sn-glycerol-3-phosphate acyltransferase
MIFSKVRALFIALEFTITVSIVIILMYMFPSKNHLIRYYWAKMQLFFMGVDLHTKGSLDETADIYMLNHQSILDIVLLEALCNRNIAWVAKKEIANIPWFGRILDAPKMIIVERENKTSLVKLLRDAKDRHKKGRPIAIFPEGTRTDGKSLRKFKAGAKMIAQKSHMKVQPIVLIGTREIFDSKGFSQKPGRVTIVYMDSIKADKSTNWYEEIEEKMVQTLKKELPNDTKFC